MSLYNSKWRDEMIWTLKKIYYRIFQAGLQFSQLFLRIRIPELVTGAGSLKRLPEVVKSEGLNNVLIVTDKVLMKLGLLKGLIKALKENEIEYTIFDEVQPNPTIQSIEDGLKLYQSNACKGIIAFGGGSPMDCAKIIGARAVRPRLSVQKMKGLFKILKKLPPLFAIPTTAGTGSETTLAAVITNPETHEKFAILDLRIVPHYAVLDPELTLKLPPDITATTGMDALTHAVEAYIGTGGNRFTNEYAEKATRIIFENLEKVYKKGSDLDRRNNMLLASYYAGVAFTRASIGYVHAMAHNLGGLYGIPHGLANAVILPFILEFYGKAVERKLARLAVASGIGKEGESDAELSEKFIARVKSMNKKMRIPTTIKELKEKDIPLLAQRAMKEANPMYPVPKLMNREQCEEMFRTLLP